MILFAFLLRGECSVWIKCSVPPEPANGNLAASSGTPPARGDQLYRGKKDLGDAATARPLPSQGTTCLCPPVTLQAPGGPKHPPIRSPEFSWGQVVQTLGKNWLERRLLGINLIEMQFRDLLCVEPVHHGRGLAGLGNLRSQFMETEAFQVRHKWFWWSWMLMGRSEGVLTYKSITGKYLENGKRLCYPFYA